MKNKRSSQRGFSLIEILITAGLLGIMALVMVTMMSNQVKANNFLQYQMQRTQTEGALTNQFLTEPNNCRCLFQNAGATTFPETISNGSLAVSTQPTEIGPFNFGTPGDCTTTTVPVPFVNSVGVDGIKSRYIRLENLSQAGTGYIGRLRVGIESTREVAGPKELEITIPVTVFASPPSAGNVQFQGCVSKANIGAAMITVNQTSIAPNQTTSVVATCPPGTSVIGGNTSCGSMSSAIWDSNGNINGNGWRAECWVAVGHGLGVTARAFCLPN